MKDVASEFINKRLLETLTGSFLREPVDPMSLLHEKLLSHDNLLKEFSKDYNPTQNQIDFARLISLNSIFKKKAKKNEFPRINSSRYLSPDHVRFEPILNLNLFKLSIAFLEKTLSQVNKTAVDEQNIADIRKILESEIFLIEKRIADIEVATKETPQILTHEEISFKKHDPDRRPKISVITASYNLAPFVEETMRSVSNQNGVDFEHIVIDGASSDDSLKLLRKYPNIVLISEKDTGYPDALWKGLKMARGEYVLQCAISDGYATTDWLKRCVEVLDSNNDISLVWGFAGRLTEDSKFTAISRPQFHYEDAPVEEKMFAYWLKTFFFYPEGNICVRKSVILKCYPTAEQCEKDNILDWLEFSYRFNRLGYISTHIPILANFGRTHDNQLGKRLVNDDSLKRKYNDFRKKTSTYGLKLLLGINEHKFIDAEGKMLNIQFNRKEFAKELIQYKIKDLFKINKKFLKLENYIKHVKKMCKINQ